MRLFIAIDLPESIKKELAGVQQRLKSSAVDASWTRAEGIHLTLKFLGEVPDWRIPEIMNALSSALSGIKGFRLEIAGAGSFPNIRNARVVWIGISGEIESLMHVRNAAEAATEQLGFKPEERTFTPHLTLGRIRNIRSRTEWLMAFEHIKDIKLTGFDVRDVKLIKSELKPSGAEYVEMGRVALR